MKVENELCVCACHEGGKVNHHQLEDGNYKPTNCSCTIMGNINYIRPENRLED